MERVLAVVVDLQNDFVNGSLGFVGAMDVIDGAIGTLNELLDNCDVDVLVTQDTHGADYAETLEARYLPIPHCIKGMWGHEIHPNIMEVLINNQKIRNLEVLEKETFGSLDMPPLMHKMEGLGSKPYDRVVIFGLVTNICVISAANLTKAAFPNTVVQVVAEASGGADLDMHRKALDVMESFHVEII